MCFVAKDENIYSMMVFSVASLLFQIVAMFSVDVGLWLFGAVLDVGIMIAISAQVKISRISLLLLAACALSVMMNFSGWIMYESYMEPDVYNRLYDVFYGALLLLLLKDFKDGARTNSDSFGISRFNHNSTENFV